MSVSIGVDIHKATLVVSHDGERAITFPNTAVGITRLIAAAGHPERVVCEPSGGYERPLLAALHAAGLPVARVQPHRVRAFAVSAGHAAKSDPLDARVLARFGTVMAPRLTPAPTPDAAHWHALSTRRAQLQEQHNAEQHRAAQVTDPDVRASCDAVLAVLTTQLTTITAQLAAHIAAHVDGAHQRQLLCSAPGIGLITAQLLISDLPELGHLDRKAIAALVGVAPVVRESGSRRHEAHIAGGRPRVRTGLWLPTMTAMRHNPVIKPLADRLHAAGKAYKVIVIACMRKLLTLLNAMLARDEPWAPRLPSA